MENMKDMLLTGKHIQKRYKKNCVLEDVCIHIMQGEIYGLIGKNGAGKTTLFRILTGLIPNYFGTVTIGKVGTRQCKVAGVINDPALFLNMTALDNLIEQAKLLNIQDQNEITNVLKIIGLEHSGQKLVKEFSLGMVQRLKLGVALLEKPDLLFLDEPVNGLDPDGIIELRDLLHRLNKEYNMTIIISSHILSELENIATSYGILSGGKIVKEFWSEEILQEGKTLESMYMQYTRGAVAL